MDRKLIDYLPHVLREVREYTAVMDAAQPELAQLWDMLGIALDDQFPATAQVDGISRWEKLLSILPKGTDTLDDRRIRVLSRIGERLPFTIRTLRNMLDSAFGMDVCEVTIDPDTYVVNCGVNIGAPAGARSELYSFLRRVVPANLPLLLSLWADICVGAVVDGHAYHTHTLTTGRHLSGTKPRRNLAVTRRGTAASGLVSGSVFLMRSRPCGRYSCGT